MWKSHTDIHHLVDFVPGTHRLTGAYLERAKPPPPKLGKHRPTGPTHTVAYVLTHSQLKPNVWK